jgi:hypothetical protein
MTDLSGCVPERRGGSSGRSQAGRGQAAGR